MFRYGNVTSRFSFEYVANKRGHPTTCERHGGLMVIVLDSGSSGPGSGPGRGHYVVFLGKTLYSHGASLPQVYKWVPAKCWGK